MQRGCTQDRRTLAVLSPAYLESAFCTPEWAAAFAADPTGQKRKLIHVRIAECDLKGLLGVLAALLLIWMGPLIGASQVMLGLGVAMRVGLPVSWKLGRIAAELRAGPEDDESVDGDYTQMLKDIGPQLGQTARQSQQSYSRRAPRVLSLLLPQEGKEAGGLGAEPPSFCAVAVAQPGW